ncbi:MAG: recombinase family protein [bacterium]
MYKDISDTNDTFYVGVYIRLSKEDNLLGLSGSINNQKKLLIDYVKENGYILHEVYIDDGYTGTNFDRPGFIKMIEDIKLNKINMVVTKDLSRLSRDYIGTGEYIEKWFPKHNVRFVALCDNIDTFDNSSNNDIAPFKAVLNDMYAKDLSKKIRTALLTMQKEGKWVGGCTPYGYITDISDKNKLIIHEKEGNIISTIFKMFYSGKNINEIKNYLNEEKIPTFTSSRNRKTKIENKVYWNYSTIKKILTNRLYTGDLVQNRRNRISYKYRKVISNPKEKWIVVENTHEPLVDKEMFFKVQKLLKKNNQRTDKKEIHLLDGLIKCGDCGANIGIKSRDKKNKCYTVCNKYRVNASLKLCTSHGNDYDKLEKDVISKLTNILTNLDFDYIYNNVLKKYNDSSKIQKIKKEIDNLNNEVEKSNELIKKLYIEKLELKITEEFYKDILIKITNDIVSVEDKRKKLIYKENIYKEKVNLKDEVNDFINFKNITRDLLLKLIKTIVIYENKDMDIYLNFK